MFEQHEEMEKRFNEIVEKFRQKGAISSDKAMTAAELDLPPRFEVAFKRRLGRLGVFIEVNGKYYLSEERLKQIEEMRPMREMVWASRKRIMQLRIAQLIAAALFLVIFLVSFFVASYELRFVSIIFLIIWLAVTVFQIYYMSQLRKRVSKVSSQSTARAP